MPGLFNKKILQQRIKNYTIENIEKKIKQIKNWQKNLENIKGLNEKRLQSAFLSALFEDILGFYSKDKGKENEGLLGIITSWDIPEIYNKLSV
jgi:hypothetical protein